MKLFFIESGQRYQRRFITIRLALSIVDTLRDMQFWHLDTPRGCTITYSLCCKTILKLQWPPEEICRFLTVLRLHMHGFCCRHHISTRLGRGQTKFQRTGDRARNPGELCRMLAIWSWYLSRCMTCQLTCKAAKHHLIFTNWQYWRLVLALHTWHELD